MITPQIEAPEIAKALGLDRMGTTLYVKREDLHPYGSHKGRSIPIMIDQKAKEGAKQFVISGSGNASLAAVRHIKARNKSGAGLKLTILVGTRMNADKRRALMSEIADDQIEIKEVADPLRTLFSMVKDEGMTSLRQSTDDDALIGYEALAKEIAETPDLRTVIMGASSGTTAQALARYFKEQSNNSGHEPVAVHIVQTENVSPIAREFEPAESTAEPSLADAIVDKVAHRREALVEILKSTGGRGWVASNSDIQEAMKLLKEKAGILATGNGALGLAGLIHAIKAGATFRGALVCIVTGK